MSYGDGAGLVRGSPPGKRGRRSSKEWCMRAAHVCVGRLMGSVVRRSGLIAFSPTARACPREGGGDRRAAGCRVGSEHWRGGCRPACAGDPRHQRDQFSHNPDPHPRSGGNWQRRGPWCAAACHGGGGRRERGLFGLGCRPRFGPVAAGSMCRTGNDRSTRKNRAAGSKPPRPASACLAGPRR